MDRKAEFPDDGFEFWGEVKKKRPSAADEEGERDSKKPRLEMDRLKENLALVREYRVKPFVPTWIRFVQSCSKDSHSLMSGLLLHGEEDEIKDKLAHCNSEDAFEEQWRDWVSPWFEGRVESAMVSIRGGLRIWETINVWETKAILREAVMHKMLLAEPENTRGMAMPMVKKTLGDGHSYLDYLAELSVTQDLYADGPPEPLEESDEEEEEGV